MLIVGTTANLEDLEREYTLAEDVSVTALCGQAGARPYVLLDGERIARIEEEEVAFVADGSGGQSLASAGDRLLLGLEGAHLVLVDPVRGDATPLSSFDQLPGRDQWENPANATPDLRSLAVSGDTWLANVHVGGVWRSSDGGATWENVIEPRDDVHEVVSGPGGRAVVAAARGFGWSSDDGRSWEWTSEGLHASYCRAVALDGDVAYVTASTGPTSSDGRLYRCRLGESPVVAHEGLPDSFPFNLDTGTLTAQAGSVALGTRDGHVYRSSGGAPFETLASELRPVTVLRFI